MEHNVLASESSLCLPVIEIANLTNTNGYDFSLTFLVEEQLRQPFTPIGCYDYEGELNFL